MENQTQNLKLINGNLELTQIQSKTAIIFHFEGILTQQKAHEFIKQWQIIFLGNESNKMVVIFDAINMSDYQPMARTLFQKSINELKSQIDSIWVISNSKIVKAGAAIMSIFSSFPITTIASLDDIKM